MPTIREGAVGAAGSLALNQSLRVVDMRDKIFHLEPSATPLTMLLNKVSKSSCSNPKFEWTEDEAKPINDTVNGTFTTTTLTTFVVDNGTYFHAHDIIKNQGSGEVMLVTGVNTTSNILTVVRNVFGTAAAAIGDAANILIMGSAFPENHAGPAAVEVVTASKYNYTQIFRDRFGVSRTAMKSKLYGGDKLAYLQKVRGIDHAKGIELALFFGERSSDETVDDGSYGRRTTGGLNQIISTNATDVTGGWALADLATTGPIDFRYGSDTKLLFCSLGGAAKIASVANASVDLMQGETTYGLKIAKLIAAAGTYLIVPHKLFTNEYADMAIVADMDQLSYRYLEDSDTKLRTNVQAPGVDGRMDEYLSEVGLERRLEKVHARWTNVVS